MLLTRLMVKAARLAEKLVQWSECWPNEQNEDADEESSRSRIRPPATFTHSDSNYIYI